MLGAQVGTNRRDHIMEKSQARCVAVIQCGVSLERCPGVKCAGAFALRKDYFAGYPEGSSGKPPGPGGQSGTGAGGPGTDAGVPGAEAGVPGEPYYVPFGCGGCPGRRVGRLLGVLKKNMKKLHGVEADRIVVHLATCVIGDNGHYTPCPFAKDIRTIIARRGLHLVEGSVYSRNPGSTAKRAAGLYAPLPPLENFK